MSNNRQILSELKRRLREQPAKRPAAKTKASAGEAVQAADDTELFRKTVTGVKRLAPSRQADIQRPQPKPIPRPKTQEAEAKLERPKDNWLPASWLNDSDTPALLTGEAGALAEALRGARPIVTDRVHAEAPKPLPIPLQRERDEKAALVESIYAPTSLDLHLEGGDELTHLCNGVPRSVLRDLRRGRWVVQDEVDLHGCNRDEARELLAACMAQWRKKGARCVRVVHGKGKGSPGRDPVLKKLVAGWLMNYEDVIAYCQARLAEGGAGALIVLLKAQRPTPQNRDSE
ncbi:Smr/MutS family protein [Uliginosibacterium gangwonense]|uniref:Smr/MutS family protein n=1 Tax=Uliginosibacterium gangwonense TaxID=392736 RepID=UPI0003799852|nr:Smr/MutS family protein [Uliginosibacterium gangwonense]